MKSAEPSDLTATLDQIDKILRSSTFATKRQLRKLLEVLSKHIDSQGLLNPDLIIRELWPDEIRTKRAADVATEMNRLRHALESFYEAEGYDDPIVITLPNRSVTDGAQEKIWIAAVPREDLEDEHARQPAKPATKTKLRVTIGILAAGLAVAAYLLIHFLAHHNPPRLGRIDGSVLHIMDADGRELWSKTFPEGLSMDWFYYQRGLARFLWFGDLEGNGHTSVLFSYLPAATPMSRPSTLICYSDQGKEKWRWTPGKELPELAGSPATYITWAVRVLHATANRPPRIVVLSQHQPWWPSQIAILDSDGKTLSEYWHSGGLGTIILADLDGTGNEDIIATGVSEYDHQATLVVLDPDRVFGASKEEAPEFQIHGMPPAQEKLRLLFRRSDLNRALFQYNQAMDPSVDHGSLRLTVAECITPVPGCNIYYEFDKRLRLIAAYAGGDDFRSAHARFYQNGKGAHLLSAEEQAAFQKVRCLVGCQSDYVPVANLVP